MDGHRARKRFSQNFLHDEHWIARIVDAIGAQAGDRVVEIGPGLSALTAPLIKAAGQVTAVEIDRDLAARLREKFSSDQLQLIEGDALALDWSNVAAQDERPLRIVGNLPYHISTPLLFALLPIATYVRDQHFMLQKEVVDRMTAEPGSKDYGRLSVMLQVRYQMARLMVVPPGAFSPPPQVHSAIVRMRPLVKEQLVDVDSNALARVVTAAFTQRRKTLRNALSDLLSASDIEQVGINPSIRAEELPVTAFIKLTEQWLTKNN